MSEMDMLQAQIDTTRAITESLFPAQPRKSAEDYAIDYIRSCDMEQIARLLTVIIDVVSDELGCADKLEDARDELLAEMEIAK